MKRETLPHAHSTVSDPYELFLVANDMPISENLTPVFRADLVNHISFTWTDDNKLVVQPGRARFFVKGSSVKLKIDGEELSIDILYHSGN